MYCIICHKIYTWFKILSSYVLYNLSQYLDLFYKTVPCSSISARFTVDCFVTLSLEMERAYRFIYIL